MKNPKPEKSFYRDLPMGFGMALMHNEEAYNKFASLSENEKQEILNGVQGISSKEEMRDYVSRTLLYDNYAEQYKNNTATM